MTSWLVIFRAFLFFNISRKKHRKTSKVNQQSVLNLWIFHHFPKNLNRIITFNSVTLKNTRTEPTGPRSAVGNVSGNRCESDCRSRGPEFDPGPVPYFRGDWSWNDFYGHSPPFRWIIQEGLLSVTSESMCTKYWLTACSCLPRKKYG